MSSKDTGNIGPNLSLVKPEAESRLPHIGRERTEQERKLVELGFRTGGTVSIDKKNLKILLRENKISLPGESDHAASIKLRLMQGVPIADILPDGTVLLEIETFGPGIGTSTKFAPINISYEVATSGLLTVNS